MYRVEIKIGDIFSDESVTIETDDFEKVMILQEFIDLQNNHDWKVDYEVSAEFLEENGYDIEED
jgi:hypothetical protein